MVCDIVGRATRLGNGGDGDGASPCMRDRGGSGESGLGGDRGGSGESGLDGDRGRKAKLVGVTEGD